MTRLQRNGLIVALVHLGIVGAIAAKFALDRSNYPRVWVQAVPFDPDLPIRGRYVRVSAEVEHARPPKDVEQWHRVRLETDGAKLTAIDDEDGAHTIRWQQCGSRMCWTLERPLAYFIPEHVPDPSRRKPGEELWIEVTVPPKGPPRPIQLAVKQDGAMTPLDLH